ncbi:GNAT family N-acetyltransferase [Planococcus sp. FY231025]|uniref:GNAT family N-acetyltransferase n=1 Tax=Planococcus sp. FY231025 TaxID=3455699 RepID=UPI003F8F52B5
MDISLSLESFPLAASTVTDMEALLGLFQTDYSNVLHEPLWTRPDSRGFAVMAYTEEDQLIGFAVSADMVGLHQYEWSVLVHPDFRRLSIGSALADGIRHGHSQRQAEGDLAAFIENPEAETFLGKLGYEPTFSEILLGVEPLEHFELPNGVEINPYSGEREALEKLLAAAFDEEILPVLAFNLEEECRDVWVMKSNGALAATMTLLEEGDNLWVNAFAVSPHLQGQGYGQAFLRWSRHQALLRNKKQVLLDVETDNGALRVYEKAGFQPFSKVEYWKQRSGNEEG